MEIDQLAGLPAHPLLVHAAVILVPLAAIALAALGWRSDWRKTYSLPVAILAVAGAIFAFLAKSSGEPVEESVKRAARAEGVQARFGDHPEQGDTAFIFAAIFALVAIGLWVVTRYSKRWKLPTWSPWAAYGLGVVVGGLALVTMTVAGHSGAELVWNDVGTFAAGN